MTDVDVEAAGLRQAKLNIGSSTQETDAALNAFAAELESHGQPWGNDELGALIGLSYQGIFEVAMDCFASNLDVIDVYAENLGAAAEALDISDADSAQYSQQARRLTRKPIQGLREIIVVRDGKSVPFFRSSERLAAWHWRSNSSQPRRSPRAI